MYVLLESPDATRHYESSEDDLYGSNMSLSKKISAPNAVLNFT
jgi:hypothetical protein